MRAAPYVAAFFFAFGLAGFGASASGSSLLNSSTMRSWLWLN